MAFGPRGDEFKTLLPRGLRCLAESCLAESTADSLLRNQPNTPRPPSHHFHFPFSRLKARHGQRLERLAEPRIPLLIAVRELRLRQIIGYGNSLRPHW